MKRLERLFKNHHQNLNISDPVKLRAMRLAMAQVITRVMDEHSMCGRSKWAWLRHRCEELRRPMQLLNDNNKIVMEQE